MLCQHVYSRSQEYRKSGVIVLKDKYCTEINLKEDKLFSDHRIAELKEGCETYKKFATVANVPLPITITKHSDNR